MCQGTTMMASIPLFQTPQKIGLLTFDLYFLQIPINTIVWEIMQEQGQGPPLPNTLNSVSATPMPHVKEWHPLVNPDLRNHLVQKL